MRQFIVFTKKEFTESLRTHKFVIMLAVFVLLGIMSPMLSKLMPEILGSFDINGVTMTLPESTANDSWGQFFKNVGQMGMLCVIIIFSGLMANEFSRGTLTNLLTKGLRRETVILSKFTAATVIWTLSYLVCLGVTTAYTAYFWELNIHNAVLAFGGMWIFGEFLIALLILGGTLFATFYGSLAITGGAIIALTLIGLFPKTAKFNPTSLSGANVALLTNAQPPSDFLPAVIITAISVVVLLALSLFVFGKKKL
ncbi:ABC transporter permease [Clostridia bacterium]|nr:ABC transporter permease [Clostridia bacterium]